MARPSTTTDWLTRTTLGALYDFKHVDSRHLFTGLIIVTERATTSMHGTASLSAAATGAWPLSLLRQRAGPHVRVVQRVQHGRLPQRVVQRHAARVLPVARLPKEQESGPRVSAAHCRGQPAPGRARASTSRRATALSRTPGAAVRAAPALLHRDWAAPGLR